MNNKHNAVVMTVFQQAPRTSKSILRIIIPAGSAFFDN